MNIERRSKYADYIADAMRFAAKETGLQWPDETIIVAKSYSELAGIDDIIGMRVFVMDMPSSFDFFVAFPALFEVEQKLQKAFGEYQGLYSLDT